MADKKMKEAVKAATNAAKRKSSDKPGIFKRLAKYFRDVKGEWKRIVWPSKKTVINNTIVVLVLVLCVAIVVWGLDAAFSAIRSLLISLL